MSAYLFGYEPRYRAINATGLPIAGAYLQFYLSGTTTPTDPYTSTTLATPISTTKGVGTAEADSGGLFAPIYLDSQIAYRVLLYTSAGVLVWDVDPYQGLSLTQAGIGAVLYPRTAAEISAGVTPTNYAYPPGNVLRYGTNTTPGTTDMTSAFNNAWASNSNVYVPAGTYLVDTLTPPTPMLRRTISGDGIGRTILNQKVAANDTFLFSSSNGSESYIEISEMSLVGLGSSTGCGIRVPLDTNSPGSWLLKRLHISNYGGRGIYDQTGLFITLVQQVEVGGCLDNQFDFLGGNTLLFQNCYAHAVPTSGKAGYRVRSGAVTFLSCTGLDGGDYWGIFGNSVAADGVLNYCQPTFIGCDMESFSVCGVLNRTGGVNIDTTTIIANNSNVIGVQVDGGNSPGYLDKYDATFQINGGTWLNSYPIHQSANGYAPFVGIGKWVTSPVITYYNDANAATRSMCGEMQAEVYSGRFAKQLSDVYVLGLFRNAYSGAATFAAATTVTVTFAVAQPDNQYLVLLGPQANKTFWVSGIGTTGFTINASAASSDEIYWEVVRRG